MHRLASAFSLLALACAPPVEDGFTDLPVEDALLGTLPEMRPPPAQSLRLSFGSVIPGGNTQVVITGLLPNESVILARGMGGVGNGPCLAAAGGACLDIRTPVFQLRRLTANAAGIVNEFLPIPSTLPVGASVGFQAIAPRGTAGSDTALSNAVLRTTTTGITSLEDVVPGDLVITEVMQNPAAVADTVGEWFEVHNTTAQDLDLQGLLVRDLGGASFTVQGPLLVGAGGYAVFGTEGNPALNGGVHLDHAYTSFSLRNDSDELILSYDGTDLETVAWDDGASFPDPNGASMSLDAAGLDATSNDDGYFWCASTSPYGDGDLGTPGAVNDACDLAPPTYAQDEDFETGDFSLFPYELNGPTPWEVVDAPASCHSGDHCMRTSPAHLPSTSSDVTLALSVREDTTVGFWARTHTEPGEHIFRFTLDGVVLLELSGDSPWTYYSFPVTATGANGADRVLRWSYERSDFFASGHPPYNEVWVDDIEIPDFNTGPTVPTWTTPGDGTLTADDPLFGWFADDADGDPVTYELQVDATTDFDGPYTTGETFAEQAQMSLAPGIWFARVRAKDDSDFRWSAWSPTITVEVDPDVSDPAWRQHVGEQFSLDDLDGPRLELDTVVATESYTIPFLAGDPYYRWPHGTPRDPITVSVAVPTDVPPGTSATLEIVSSGPWDPGNYQVYFDQDQVISYQLPGSNRSCTANHVASFAIPDISAYAADGNIDLEIDMNLLGGCTAGWWATASLSFDYFPGLPGSVLSTPIEHALTFDGDAFWDKLTWESTGSVALQVLDGFGDPVPDTLIPGNSTGLPESPVALYAVDPALYPTLQLRADIGNHATLSSWQVTGGDDLVWSFAQDGQAEGWVAADQGATTTLSVANGLATLSGDAGGADPHMTLLFDTPLAAERFESAWVALRTSNNYIYDDVSWMWASNYGDFDTRRSFTQSVFLYEFTEVTYDLTQVPTLPNEAWQGDLDGVRIDPVDTFVDQVGAPAPGWAEIEEIRLR